MEYIKDVVIHETNKFINSAMNSSEYFRVIGCRLNMDCYVGHSVRDFFFKDTITPRKVPPSASAKSSSGKRLDNITQVISYKNIAITEFNYPFSNRGRYRKGGTRTWRHILIHHGSVLLMSQSRSGLIAKLSRGGCLSPTSLTLLGTSIKKIRVLNIRLFIMLRSWRGRIDLE